MADLPKLVVIKIGSSTLTTESGELDAVQLRRLVTEFAGLKKSGHSIIIVSSGAIAAGKSILGFKSRPKSIPDLQAIASVGQVLLLQKYSEIFSELNIKVGQILITAFEITNRVSYLNAKSTLKRLLDLDVVPIVNENDSVAVDEIKFGDNDTLAALVAVLAEADILINLSDTPGLYTGDPRKGEDARFIERVTSITPDLELLAQGPGTEDGSGGMITKIQAAKIVTSAKIPMVIAEGVRENAVTDLLSGVDVGTYFEPQRKKMASRKAWIAFGRIAKGTLVVDDGAKKAILLRGTSLLPAGIVESTGDFSPGDAVDIVDLSGERFAKGLSSYSSDEVKKIKGLRSSELSKALGEDGCDEVVHRDEMVIF